MGSPTTLSSLVIGSLAFLAIESSAAIVPVTQDRFVEAGATAVLPGQMASDDDAASAADFGLFDVEIAPIAVANQGGMEISVAQGVAKQTSSFGASSVSASGEAGVGLTILPVAGASAGADGTSLFEFLFMVDVESTYSLSGAVDTQAIVSGDANPPSLSNSVLFEDVDNGIILFQTLTGDEPFGIGGILNPGTYRLLATAGASAEEMAALTVARTVAGISSYDLNFRLVPVEVPEPSTVAAALVVTGLCGVGVWRSRRRNA